MGVDCKKYTGKHAALFNKVEKEYMKTKHDIQRHKHNAATQKKS